jgi:hypothetical protein
MAYQDLALPVDIPWKRLAASSDMMDTQIGDRRFPPKWRSSISIFYHEPTDLPETYCDRKVTYLKVVCSITGMQGGGEVSGYAGPDDVLYDKVTQLGALYHPCYGAMLQVAVFPQTQAGMPAALADYPYIIDFEPKRRELYEAVSRSGEILGRSTSTLNLRKSGTGSETTDLSSIVGAEVKAGTQDGLQGRLYGENRWGGGTHVVEENVQTTDESREKRETYSATTSLTQMYELLTGYHLGTNRALFYMLPRPHTTEEKDQFTFTNGPRRLEGIQEVFLVVNRPKDQQGLCVEAFLETAHLFAAEAEPEEGDGAPEPQVVWEPHEFVTGMYGTWPGTGLPDQIRDFPETLMSLPPGCELDTSRGGHSFQSGESDGEPSVLVTVPPGFWFDFQDGTVWASIESIRATVTGGQVIATVRLRGLRGSWQEKFNAQVHVYYRCQRTVEPQPEPTAQAARTMFLTSRGLTACVELPDTEASGSGSIVRPVDWDRLFSRDSREDLLGWLDRHQVLDLEGVPEDRRREELEAILRRNRRRVKRAVEDVVSRGTVDVPEDWLRPTEWVTFETSLPTDRRITDPRAPAAERIRAANDLSSQIGEQMIESLGSARRYEDRAVDFLHSNVALMHLSRAVRAMDEEGRQNKRLADLEVPHKDRLVSAFGDDVRRRELATLDVGALRAGLRISEPEARRLKLELIRAAEGSESQRRG